MNLDEYALQEALRVKYVVRNGKRVKKWVTTRKGKYRVEYDENGKPREVRITATERRKRKLGQRRGKLKRLAKMGRIELKRKKSFITRRNIGMQYNKKLPDIVTARGPNGRVSGAPTGAPKMDTLHPVKESLILEAPHAYLFSDADNDYCWDFYAETIPDSSWLEQVIDIYTKRQIITINPEGSNPNEGELNGLSDEHIEDITENLMYSLEFINYAADAFVNADEDLKERFRNSVPAKLFDAMLPMINSLTVKKDKQSKINKLEV